MKRTLLLITLTCSLSVFGQTEKAQLIAVMEEYVDNYGKPEYGHDFVDDRLNPALLKVEQLTCEGQDYGLFNSFLKMLSATTGSANEVPADVLGGVFICKPEVVEKYLLQVYTDKYLVGLLEFGFGNQTYNREDEIENYDRLKSRLKRLKKELVTTIPKAN